MFKKIKEILQVIQETDRNRFYFKNISNSAITIINRPPFEICESWFNDLLTISYDKEVKSKYKPILHQENSFERDHLSDILHFREQIDATLKYLNEFERHIENYKEAFAIFSNKLHSQGVRFNEIKNGYCDKILKLNENISEIEINLLRLLSLYKTIDGYKILSQKGNINFFLDVLKGEISIKRIDWEKIRDEIKTIINKGLTEAKNTQDIEFEFRNHFYKLIEQINNLYWDINEINQRLDYLKSNSTCKIIVGDAGSGKTHIAVHLIEKLRKDKDYVIFFKPRQFNGDNISLSKKLLELLNIPKGYTLTEILQKLNKFAILKNRRCIFIIDALNETTKSSIGFSKIWQDQLQDLINQIGIYSNLYFICTLRTSYVPQIWNVIPLGLVKLRGFEKSGDLRLVCQKYFEYYKIDVENFDTADLSIFNKPLLLDLYCKLINEQREYVKKIKLDLTTYIKIFEDYIANVSDEVQQKLNLQQKSRIIDGFFNSSDDFFKSIEATVSVDVFSRAFDDDPLVTIDKSIAAAVLEGYLVFIKDVVNKRDEIVKHTQQEVGGYLIAANLLKKFPNVNTLITNPDFNKKIISNNTDDHHQLRLDILKFLIALKPDLITKIKTKDSFKLSWWYLYNGFSNIDSDTIPKYLLAANTEYISIEEILDSSDKHWFNTHNQFNFHFIAKVLEKLSLWEFDLSWTFYIYKNEEYFYEFLEHNIQRIKSTEIENNEDELAYAEVVAKFAALTTATTIRDLRDLATLYLIEFGQKYPLKLLTLTVNSTKFADEYIYERLVSACYGVCLILQNNDSFIKSKLPKFATQLYKLQFDENPEYPVFNYIVIDSIKHLIDLAIFKKVFELLEVSRERVRNYQFVKPFEWTTPSDDQRKLINSSSEMSWPEPIGMDFGIYTIPRLIDKNLNERGAIANVYKRIFEIGFQEINLNNIQDAQFKNFLVGLDTYRSEGKVDRLGKKYSWKGFFDYAGNLLLHGKLNVFEDLESGTFKIYNRLSDVDIDICLPSKSYIKNIRIYQNDLFEDLNKIPNWNDKVRIDSLIPLLEYNLDSKPYIMLNGMVDQRTDDEYKIRSFLLLESCFVKRSDEFYKLGRASHTLSNWKLDNHLPVDNVRHSYFGELYWADNMRENSYDSVRIPTNKIVNTSRTLTIHDIFSSDEFKRSDIGREISELKEERIWLEAESSIVDYLWESDSKIIDGHSEFYPSVKMGKQLKLKADPTTGRILDSDLYECFQTIEYKKDFFSNTFSYMRSDLLRKYMKDNDLVLMYQIKQHSYDNDRPHNRSMKFIFLE